MLALDKPLVIFDIETTGTSPAQDRIIQMAAIKIQPDGSEEEFEWLVNPGCAIPEDSTAVHGIKDEDVIFAPSFSELAQEILTIFKGADLGGYNAAKFDIPLLINEFKRVGIDFDMQQRKIIDPFVIYRMMEPKTLEKAYQFYCQKTLEGAHSALPDTRAAWEVLKSQVNFYPELPKTIDAINQYCQELGLRGNSFESSGRLAWVSGEVSINFGKNKGRSLKELAKVDRGYLEWVISQDFSEEVKQTIREALTGKFPQKNGAA